jgi:hypothetical protein
MKRLLFVLIIILAAVCIMAAGPGPTKPPPEKTQPPPVETEPPPAETKPPVETEPAETEPPDDPAETPERGTTPEPNKPEQERIIRLPQSGYGPPQTAPACASMLLALIVLAWKVLR